ncbi:Zinc finger protein 710-like [Homarus americanus]|uniref:Zinc finger protein 710-like n=1 Tax=Homarus americanus TaxID=6706 RepID=A0A8J5K4G2_HOMAM|nr:Zinc finger protein 710-like [Homarus americanus]
MVGSGEWSAYTTWDVGVIGKQRGGVQPPQCRISSSSIGGLCEQPLPVSPTMGRRHIRTADKVFACPTCGKTFNNAKDCRRHAVIHTGIKPFKCPYCPHRANLKFNLTKHIQAKHKPVQFTTTN